MKRYLIQDRGRADFLRNHEENYLAESKQSQLLIELRKRLLAINGEFVLFTLFDEDLPKILSRGRTWPSARSIMKEGEPCRCHQNSAFLWSNNRRKLKVVTGWALSDDGLWRQHTWCWWPKQRKVVETTVSRVAYFGFEMTTPEAEELLSNYRGFAGK